MPRQAIELPLFWRTFALLVVLLAGAVLAWTQTLRALEFAPNAQRAVDQAAGLVSLSQATLKSADGAQRQLLLRNLGGAASIRVRARDAADRWDADGGDRLVRQVAIDLRARLGPEAIVAASVNDQPGLWVSFALDRERYWLQMPALTEEPLLGSRWMLWAAIVLASMLLASALVARLINQPLRQLSYAASRVRGGDLDSRLDENTLTSEIREVNMGFNRMARELARVEEDRAVMLAGISHDLRTPLARLRLETEMSVSDEEAKHNMAMDIDQLDAIIDKFMDYARPGETQMRPVHVSQLIDREAGNYRDPTQIRINSRVAIDLNVMADETELGRVFQNLFENARRYGRGTYTGVADVLVTYVRTGPWVIITVRDHGPGAAPEKLSQLTTPFFRGDAARTAATGAGLGLAIVDKAMQRMGGSLELTNAPDGGLMAHIRLRRAP
ncbi:MAG: ATP-binding protein [Rubrivivax sp.]|nr:ATP-binding protein [Rubrivivax sp.]